MTFVVGVTGGIGSGKSAATAAFEALGIAVVDADVVAREVVLPGTSCLDQIAAHFGDAVLTDEGTLDRKALRHIVFSDAQAKDWLNALLHPAIRRELLKQLAQAQSSYVILSAPLLLENGLQQYCDRVVVVDAPESTQRQRVARRDGSAKEEVDAIMRSQLSRTERLHQADDVIDNAGTLEALQQQVATLHQRYLAATIAPQK